MSNKTHKKNIKSDQRGIASMVIVILIMTLLTLLVIAFARNANREQRQSLDRQLNSQAFYAAESGVNDARDYVFAANAANNTIDQQKTDCDPTLDAEPDNYFKGIAPNVGVEGASYTCVLYDLAPETLLYSDLEVDNSVFVPISDANADQIETLTFSWIQDGGGSNFSGCPAQYEFPTNLTDCDAGGLRISLIDDNAADRQTLIDKTFLAFVMPASSTSSSVINYSAASGSPDKQGVAISADCNTSNKCSITINGISSSGSNQLYLHLRSLYKINDDVEISGTTSSGSPVEFVDAQMVVDATGKAADVLKRIQVRIAFEARKSRPEFVLQTAGDVCKQLDVLPNDVKDNCNPTATP